MSRVACIGAGMTKFVRRAEESSGELAAQAVNMALEDAGLTMDDIDSVVLGTAPDAFDGIHMNGEHLIAGSGGKNKPYMRHFVGGGTGVFSPIHGWMHVASGKFRNCLVVTEEKMSPCVPHPAGAFLTIFDRVTEQPLYLTLLHIFALEMARFMEIYGWTEEELAWVSVNNKKNALDHPAAQIPANLTVEDVLNSKLLSWPVKRYDISPTSDGAVAIVLSNEDMARAQKKHPVFIEGVGYRLDTAYWCTRDLAFPNYVAMAARDAYKMAGISVPEDEIQLWEPYDPFDYKALHHMNGLLMDRTGRKVRELFESGAFARDGTHPLCPSGGALGVGNPIAATGLMKIAELYFQLSGQAGARQVKRPAHRGIAQAWGDLMQVGTVVIMGAEGAPPNVVSHWNDKKREDLPGTEIKKISDVPSYEDSPDLRYMWDNGFAITAYLDGFKKGAIRGSSVKPDGTHMMVPCREFHELQNLRTASHYWDLPGTGTIKTWTHAYVDWASLPLPEGKVDLFAIIALDGCDEEDMGIVHRLGEVEVKDIHIGMRVKAVWKPEEEREGSVTDVLYFRPLRDDDVIEPPKPIKPPELHAGTAKATPGAIPLSYAYTVGIAGKRFYDDLAQGKISGTQAGDEVYLPPAAFCEDTLAMLDPQGQAVQLDPNSGEVVAFTLVTEDRGGHVLDQPVFVVQVAFEGAVGSVFGKLEGDHCYTGMEVKLKATDKVGPHEVWFEAL